MVQGIHTGRPDMKVKLYVSDVLTSYTRTFLLLLREINTVHEVYSMLKLLLITGYIN